MNVLYSGFHALILVVCNADIYEICCTVAVYVMTDKSLCQMLKMWKTEMSLSLVTHKHRVCDLQLSQTDKGNDT